MTITLAAAVLTAEITLVTTVVDNPVVITLVATVVDNHLGYYIGLQRYFSYPSVLTADHYSGLQRFL